MRFFVIIFVAYSLLARAQQPPTKLTERDCGHNGVKCEWVELTNQQRKDFESLLKTLGMENLRLSSDVEVFNQDLKEKGSRPLSPEHAAVYPLFVAEHNAKLVGTYIQLSEVNIMRSEAIRAAVEVTGMYLDFKNDQNAQNKLSLLAMMKPADRQLLNCAPQAQVEECDQFDKRDHRRWEDISGQFRDCLVDLAAKLQNDRANVNGAQCANEVRQGVRNFISESSNYQVYDGTNRPRARPGVSRAQP